MAEHQPGWSAGARRRGRHERRHQLADAAERVPPETRRGEAGGRQPGTSHHAPPGHRRGGASDQSVIHMRRPTAGRGAAECRVARDAMRRACGRPRPRRLPAKGAGSWRRSPHREDGECKRRDDRGDRMDHPIIGKLRLRSPEGPSRSQRPCRRPLERRPLAGAACAQLAVARHAGQRSSVRSRLLGPGRAGRSFP